MTTPILIDTDMGVDDAVTLALALSCPEVELVGLASVAGNVSLDQATDNIARVLGGLGCSAWPCVARGLPQQDNSLRDAGHVFGKDGLGETDLPIPSGFAPGGYLELYEQLIDKYAGKLVILAIGPLTNLAAVLQERPGLLQRAGRILVMGGAVWCPGNVTPHAEFNFYRDPRAAAMVLGAGLPVTVVPLDVTRQVAMDESHIAQLAGSRTRGGELLARMIEWPLRHWHEAGAGKFLVHDATALGALLWPSLFMRAMMGLDVVTTGPQAGKTRPMVVKEKQRQIGVTISVRVVDLLENLIEQLCQQHFIV